MITLLVLKKNWLRTSKKCEKYVAVHYMACSLGVTCNSTALVWPMYFMLLLAFYDILWM